MKKIISSLLLASVLTGVIGGCAAQPQNTNVTVKGEPVQVNIQELSSSASADFRAQYLNTSFELLKKQIGSNENVMISPASIMIALSMAEAGANGNTKTQMAALWGGENDPDGQLSYAADIYKRLNNSTGVTMHAADSAWLNEQIMKGHTNSEYIDFVKKYYNSEVNSLAFDDNAVNKMNKWVSDNTNNMIDRIIESLEPSSAMVLMNAIAFEGKWAEAYEDHQVQEGVFNGANGQEQKTNLLFETSSSYLENDIAEGFIKYYEGGQYAYVVMLPKDKTQSADDMLKNFTGDMFDEFVKSETHQYDVYTKLPEFKYDYETALVDTLKELGMTDAFASNADFTGIATFDDDTYLYINKVIHKTHIELDRNGTKAAAVTAVMIDAAGAILDEKESKEVFCDRPFAYAIVDMTDNTPVFIGTVNNI